MLARIRGDTWQGVTKVGRMHGAYRCCSSTSIVVCAVCWRGTIFKDGGLERHNNNTGSSKDTDRWYLDRRIRSFSHKNQTAVVPYFMHMEANRECLRVEFRRSELHKEVKVML